MNYFNDIAGVLSGADGEGDLLLVCTQAGRVLYMSGSLRLSVGDDLTGRNLNDFVADKLVASIVSHAQQGRPFSFEFVLRDRIFSCQSEISGDNIHITLTPLGGGDGVFINKNSAEFISREINISLAMMFSASRSLENEALSESGREDMAVLRRNMYRLLRLSRNMLDCALVSGGELSLRLAHEDLAAVCRELGQKLAPVMRGLDIELTLNIPETPVLCNIDRDKFERMIYNLAANSIIAAENKREITLSLVDRGQSVALTVTDRGRGIEPEILQQVFSKHVSLSPAEYSGWNGAGFGLSLVNSFARRHGGNLVITSLIGEGTSACVTLPKNEESETMPLGSLNPDYAGGHDRVLVELSTALGKEFYAV